VEIKKVTFSNYDITNIPTIVMIPYTFLITILLSTMSKSYFNETKGAGTTVQITFDQGEEKSTPKYALGYWSIRGLGAPLTMMLCASKVPFSLFLYDIIEKKGEEGGWDSDYFGAKPGYIKDYKTPLWNLPFFVDRENENVICQTNAVFAYLGRVCNMLGSDIKSTSQCEQLLCEIYDLRDFVVRFAYGPTDACPKEMLTNAKKHLSKLESWLELEAKAADKKDEVKVVHLVGGKFSAPDFHLFEMLDQVAAFAKYFDLGDLFADYPRLKDFKDGFAALP
jgi:hypothetical protein